VGVVVFGMYTIPLSLWGTGADSLRAYDERRPPEPTFPATRPSIADFVAEDGEELPEAENVNGNGIENGVNGHLLKEVEDIERQHAPPGCGSPSFTLSIL
jgi:hypothetical protein